jgi:hypothetical protein
VGEPPNASPQSATARYTTGALDQMLSSTAASANSSTLAIVSRRRWRSISTPTIQIPASDASPNTSSTRSVRSPSPALARNAAIYVYRMLCAST